MPPPTMMNDPPAATVTPVVEPVPGPQRVWILLGTEWENNDELTYAVGTSPEPVWYPTADAAHVACARRNHQFYTVDYPTPADFEPDWDDYGGPPDDPTAVTWDELRAAGFSDPYTVGELTLVGSSGKLCFRAALD